MGLVVHAACPCGFTRAELLVGFGQTRNDLWGFSYLLPAVCLTCGAFDTLNYFQNPEPLCATCHTPLCFYTEAQPRRRREDVSDERDLPSLAEDCCLCPACRQHTLTFGITGLWD